MTRGNDEDHCPDISGDQIKDDTDMLFLVTEDNPFLIQSNENLAVLIRPVMMLTLFGDDDTDFLDTIIEIGHEDDVLRDIFATLLFRYHKIDQITMRQYIITKRIKSTSPTLQNVEHLLIGTNNER